MMTDEEYINQFLNLPRSELINIKYITDGFHELKLHGKLDAFLNRYSNGERVYDRVFNELWADNELAENWEVLVKDELNTFIKNSSKCKLNVLDEIKLSPISYDKLNFETDMSPILFDSFRAEYQSALIDNISHSELIFLESFFHGVQSSKWTRSIFLFEYSMLHYPFSNLLRALGKSVDFGITDSTLIIDKQSSLSKQ